MNWKRNLFIAFVIIVFSNLIFPNVLATKTMPTIEEQCCAQTHQGDPILFQYIADDGRIVGGLGAGRAENWRDAQRINISISDLQINGHIICCDYVSDKDSCLQCVEDTKQRLERSKFYTKLKIYGFISIGLIVLLFLIWFIRKKIKSKK